MARHDGYTIPTPVCGTCGYVPFTDDLADDYAD
jgi:hypothetical protein